MFDMDHWGSGYPHAAVHAGYGCNFVTGSEADNESFYVYSVAGGFDFEAQGGSIEQYFIPQHVGVGHSSRARDGGNITHGSSSAPVVHNGTGGTEDVGAVMQQPGAHAQYGGQIRLIGWDGSVLGTVRAGQIVPVDRNLSADPFGGAGTTPYIVDGSESSHIYRS